MSFQTVILEAAKARAEQEAEYQAVRDRRRQELADAAREADAEEAQGRRVRWSEWLPYLEASMGRLTQFEMAAHISEAVGFHVCHSRVSAAIQLHDVPGRRKLTRAG